MKYGKLTLGQVEALINRIGGEEVVRGILDDTGTFQVIEVPKVPLLEHVGTVGVPAATEPFVVSDHFKVDVSEEAPIRISFIHSSFHVCSEGITEKPEVPVALQYSKLMRRPVTNASIIAELGGEDVIQTTFRCIYTLMKLQRNGEDGVLNNNGHFNLFYVRNGSKTLSVVFTLWKDDGWRIFSYLAESLVNWGTGDCVFYRNS